MKGTEVTDRMWMRRALRLARRGLGGVSPNPMVGAILVRRSRVLGQGWHRRAGGPHAEIEALRDAERRGITTQGATLYVTLEPCSTQGRTPPCTQAIVDAGVARVVVAATDPNPAHQGRGFEILREAGLEVNQGVLAEEATAMNEAFNHWIVTRTPFVTVKAAMTLDGKIATASGESKWITGELARREGMRLRKASDAVLVGVNTVVADDPALTVRSPLLRAGPGGPTQGEPRRRVILDSRARTPLSAQVVRDENASRTTIVVTRRAARVRVTALARRVRVLEAPESADGGVDLRWLLARLGEERVTALLVEGGGEVNASFLLGGLAQRVAFFYAPLILGGARARRAVAGLGAQDWNEVLRLDSVRTRRLGADLYLNARVRWPKGAAAGLLA